MGQLDGRRLREVAIELLFSIRKPYKSDSEAAVANFRVAEVNEALREALSDVLAFLFFDFSSGDFSGFLFRTSVFVSLQSGLFLQALFPVFSPSFFFLHISHQAEGSRFAVSQDPLQLIHFPHLLITVFPGSLRLSLTGLMLSDTLFSLIVLSRSSVTFVVLGVAKIE